MSNNVQIARKLANQSWGRILTQKKLLEGIWYFDCEGHGGYVVDTNIYPQFNQFYTPVFVRKNSIGIMLSEQHFAIFEEDCNYAIVEYVLFEQLAEILYEAFAFNRKYKTFNDFKVEYKKSLLESLKKWNNDWLELFEVENGKEN